jgi:hypothetical protein
MIDAADYVIWRHSATSTGRGLAVGSEVPEPALFSLLLIVGSAFLAARRR